MDFIADNLILLLFAIILIILLVFTKKNRSLNAPTSVYLVWISFAASLTFTYIVGIIDYGFFEASLLGYGKNDFVTIIVPGAITLILLVVRGFPEFINKVKGDNKDSGGDR